MPLFNDIVYSAGIPVIPNAGAQYFDRVLWVSSNGGSDANAGTSRQAPLASLFGTAGAWAKAADPANNSALGGTLVIVMKGHTESVTGADAGSALGSKARVYTIGQGEGPERPTLTWTAAGSTLLLDQQATVLDNFNLNFEPGSGTVTVAAALTMSGAGSGLRRITGRVATDVNNRCSLAVTVTAADCFVDNPGGSNLFYGAVAGQVTTVIRLTAADRFRLENTRISAATGSTTTGVVQFLTTASTHVFFNKFAFLNTLATSTVGVSGLASVSGVARKGLIGVLANTAGELTTAWNTKASMEFADVLVTNDLGESGTTLLPVSA